MVKDENTAVGLTASHPAVFDARQVVLDVRDVVAQLQAAQEAWRSMMAPNITEWVRQMEAIRSVNAESIRGAALTAQSIREAIEAMRIPRINTDFIDAIQKMQEGLRQSTESLGIEGSAMQASLRDLMTVTIPPETVQALRGIQTQIARDALTGLQPADAPGHAIEPSETSDAQQEAVEAAVAVAVSAVATMSAKLKPEDITVEWIIQSTYLVLIASGIIGTVAVSSFLTAIAASLFVHLLQSRSASAENDRIVASNDKMMDALDRLGERVDAASDRDVPPPSKS